jgi:hypothetical protein
MPTQPSPVCLQELNLPALLDNQFQLGELLARTNAAGGLLPPDLLAHATMTVPLGRWQLRTREAIVPASPLTPALAATQFQELEGEFLRAVLSGYARQAYQVLEPDHPGFVAQLLRQLLPGVRVEAVAPRPGTFDLEQVVQAYGISLDADTQLSFSPPAPAPATSDENLLLATLVVFVAQQDLTRWLAHVAAGDAPTRPLTQLLGAFARGPSPRPGGGAASPKAGAGSSPLPPPWLRWSWTYSPTCTPGPGAWQKSTPARPPSRLCAGPWKMRRPPCAARYWPA